MSYQDLEEAREKRKAKDKDTAANKGKRGRKRKIPALEEPEAGPSVRNDKMVRMSEDHPANTEEEVEDNPANTVEEVR